MSLFKLSNQIFQLGLDAQEMSVYAYLCSLPPVQNTITGQTVVHVRQSTIAQNCGIRAAQTVAKIISRLHDKGLTEPLERSVKCNRHKGSYRYAVTLQPADKNYFFVERRIFGDLIPRQIMIYLFLCKAYSTTMHISWNSYNDIAKQTGMKRETVIRTVNELAAKHLIIRMRRRSRENNHVFVDNHYQIILFKPGRIKGKINVRLHSEYNRTRAMGRLHSGRFTQCNLSTFFAVCQGLSGNFFTVRGSP